MTSINEEVNNCTNEHEVDPTTDSGARSEEDTIDSEGTLASFLKLFNGLMRFK